MDLAAYGQVKHSIRNLLGIDLTAYKDEQMRRRLDSWLTRTGAPSWPNYFSRLRGDVDELARFRDYLTINVSAFFRDPERWQALRTEVIPDLLGQAGLGRGLRVWSAGCSNGQEPYSLAMLLDEVAPGRRHTIYATDLDRGALARAQARGPYPAEDLRNLTPAQMTRYVEPKTEGPYFVKPSLVAPVTFREHNLLRDPLESSLDLILCRNVVIYFTDEAKQSLYRRFAAALRPGGVLFVGGTEVLPRPPELGFRSRGISFYSKV
jgi:chemotaxis protein methyltransferase CheR